MSNDIAAIVESNLPLARRLTASDQTMSIDLLIADDCISDYVFVRFWVSLSCY
jgi:hypothetical protein